MKTDLEIYKEVFGENSNGCYHFPELKQLVLLYAQAYHEDKTRWISVEERLPENREEVLCYYAKYDRIISNNYEQHTDQDKDWFIKNFSHWQPLPSPPKS